MRGEAEIEPGTIETKHQHGKRFPAEAGSDTGLVTHLVEHTSSTVNADGESIVVIDGEIQIAPELLEDIQTVITHDPVNTLCLVVATSNVTVATPPTTIDGITMAAGVRVLLVGQVDRSENGPYYWHHGSDGGLQRPDDWQVEMQAGVSITIAQGDVYQGSTWTPIVDPADPDPANPTEYIYTAHGFLAVITTNVGVTAHPYCDQLYAVTAGGVNVNLPAAADCRGITISAKDAANSVNPALPATHIRLVPGGGDTADKGLLANIAISTARGRVRTTSDNISDWMDVS